MGTKICMSSIAHSLLRVARAQVWVGPGRGAPRRSKLIGLLSGELLDAIAPDRGAANSESPPIGKSERKNEAAQRTGLSSAGRPIIPQSGLSSRPGNSAVPIIASSVSALQQTN